MIVWKLVSPNNRKGKRTDRPPTPQINFSAENNFFVAYHKYIAEYTWEKKCRIITWRKQRNILVSGYP
jgi:hypothetical protein